MSKVVFSANEYERIIARSKKIIGPKLNVSELFYDTIQGEGPYAGYPAVFLRLAGCTLNCTWCDTKDVWKNGFSIGVDELIEIMSKTKIFELFRDGVHFVITGGSPLLQQKSLISFLRALEAKLLFLPFIEIENEAVLMPEKELELLVDAWNNSPKLINSGNSLLSIYKEDILSHMNGLPNSIFKFVVRDLNDVMGIQFRYIETGLISRKKVWLMPEGATREDLKNVREKVVRLATRFGFKYTDRLQIILWNNKKLV